MARQERLVNNASTTLNAGINASVTSLVVDLATAFPTEGDFRIIIDSEILLVTAVSGTTFTVVRGADSSSAASHSLGATVTAIVTKGSITQFLRDKDPWFNLKPPCRIVDTNGVALTSTDFTELNFTDNAVSSDDDGNITITKDDTAGDSISALWRTAPTAPYAITAGFTYQIFTDSGIAGPFVGACFIGDPTDNIVSMSYQPGNASTAAHRVLIFTSPTAFSSQLAGAEPNDVGDILWHRIEDDGVNLRFSFSRDGVNFQLLATQARGSSFTTAPNKIGFYIDNIQGKDGSSVSLVAWDGE